MPLPTNRANTTVMTDTHPQDHNDIATAVNGLQSTDAALFTAVGNAANAASAAQADVDTTQFNLGGAGVGYVVHGSTAGTARPNKGFGIYIWLGTVQPTNWANNDIWIDTSP